MTPPTVTINTAAAAVSRTIAVAASATDDRGVMQVEFLVDGAVAATDTTAPYGFDWNTASLPDGTHTVTARASDAAANTATSTGVAFVVQNNFAFAVVLAGAAEIPATTSLAAGTSTLNVNVGTGAVSGSLVLTGMTATAAHIHDGFAGINGPVLIGLNESASTPGTWELPAGASLTAAQVDALLAGGLYLNAHSSTEPAGEIRGQILAPNLTVALASLTGLQEVPEVVTTAAGNGAVTVDRASGTVTIHMTVTNVVAPTAAHLHQGPGGRNGPVLIPLSQDGSNPAHWFATSQPIAAAALAALDAGGTYLNIHTTANTGGEARGQVIPAGVSFVVNRLEEAQEVPATGSIGQGTVAVTVNQATRDLLLHANVTGVDDATVAHIHQAYAGSNGPVIVPLTKDTADVTHWSASGIQLTADQLASLARGKLYVNVHTPANPGGEIRGQLIPPGVRLVQTAMAGENEVPPVTTTAVGDASTTVDLVTGTVTIHVHATGVDDATAAHIHRAPGGTNGPVIVPLTRDAVVPGHWLAEEQPVTAEQLQDFLGALWYVNLHTPAHPGGEIRGQIAIEQPPVPDTSAPTVTLAPLPATVSGAVELAATATDDVGVASVRFLVNGTVIGTDTTAPHAVTWDTTTTPNGAASIGADATDAAGNQGLATALNVTVSNAAPATTLTQLQATVFTPICSACHTGGGAALPGSMNLSSAAATHAALVNVASEQRPAVMRVRPNDAAGSYIVHKLEGGPDIVGVRMPQGGPFLSVAQIDTVKSWINAGALNN
jgi:mono/diheme cytochrome c family protein